MDHFGALGGTFSLAVASVPLYSGARANRLGFVDEVPRVRLVASYFRHYRANDCSTRHGKRPAKITIRRKAVDIIPLPWPFLAFVSYPPDMKHLIAL